MTITREKTIDKKKVRIRIVHRYRSDKLSRLVYFEDLKNQKDVLIKKTVDNKLYSWRENSTDPRTIYCQNILFIGQTGTGKSTTLNHLLSDEYMKTSDFEACTRTIDSSEVYIGKNCYLCFCDMPGIGESNEADKKYLELYSRMTDKSDVIVYLLSSDKRDYGIDLKEFRSLKRKYSKKIFIALNGIDKIEPISRNAEWNGPTQEQSVNIDRKIEDIRKLFRVKREDIIPYSAQCNYKLDDLAEKITNILIPQSIGEKIGTRLQKTGHKIGGYIGKILETNGKLLK